ncbi:molybdate metabolism regulator [Rhodopirellula europaea]|uniref:Molybdate metabolism regulator n=1 Tax=Rhodopirellula europaea 6C TaxID=1263867 RepID=M2AYQ9_9BACT|nr:molybdate metabolism regulator [Rhodopirellula europaea]EMB17837.1 molybdate metabolism regulator [Rhodopirellula europaea 6C]
MTEHDPFNEPESAHPRARELMREPFFWDCVDEAAPFGSDEGNEAYYEWRSWREENPKAALTECFDWILAGNLHAYNESLASVAQIEMDVDNPDDAILGDQYDMFTLDTTIIATGLGQLMDEGVIDPSAKPFLHVAIKRQRNPKAGHYDGTTLDAIARVVNEA